MKISKISKAIKANDAKNGLRRILVASFILGITIIFLFLYKHIGSVDSVELYSYYKKMYIHDTYSQNAVTAIYLNYRVFDTFFEALLLMICVTGIMYFFKEKSTYNNSEYKEKKHELLEAALNFLYPIIIVFGIYLILYGSKSPGGGFQGGAVLAAVFMSRYLVNPGAIWHVDSLKNVEKMLYLLIVSFSSLLILANSYIEFKSLYLIIMNFLIGFKVFCGLSIIFFYFAYIDTDSLESW